jgi:hypothetical protein
MKRTDKGLFVCTEIGVHFVRYVFLLDKVCFSEELRHEDAGGVELVL